MRLSNMRYQTPTNIKGSLMGFQEKSLHQVRLKE